MLREDKPAIEPYFPNGEAWSPKINKNVNNIILNANKVGSVFDSTTDGNGTNQYTEIYTSAPKYLNLTPLPIADYLPIYSTKNSQPSEKYLQEFLNKYLDAATVFFGVNSKRYTITQVDGLNDSVFYTAKVNAGKQSVSFIAQDNWLRFTNHIMGDERMIINGSRISILESDTDEQIKEKLKDTIEYICTSFSKQYSNIKICRSYSYNQMEKITIYLYSPEESIFPSNFSESPMTSNYISLEFYTDWGSGSLYDWSGSKNEAFLINISLYETLEKWNEYYNVDAKSKMLTLEEAEQLLKKGYVFGGHSCDLCMAVQPEVDFSSYTYVDIEYVSNKNRDIYIPFYAFYKYMREYKNGIIVYAKTYVPAVQVSGYDEYFESQKINH